MTNRFLDLLARRDGPIVADGGMGTMLMAAGLPLTLAQALTVARFGPRAPRRIETMPDAMSASIIGTKNGLTLFGPRVANVAKPLSSVSMPPMAEPMTTPTRSRFAVVIFSPDW